MAGNEAIKDFVQIDVGLRRLDMVNAILSSQKSYALMICGKLHLDGPDES